jgi:hypothetical protein
MMSEIVHVNPQGRRLFTTQLGDTRLVLQAATATEVHDWFADQLGPATAAALAITDAGHADRTEVTHWGLTDRI